MNILDDSYYVELDRTDRNVIQQGLDDYDGDIAGYLEKQLSYLDCTRTFPNGMRVIQTIDYVYKHNITVCNALIDMLDGEVHDRYVEILKDIHAKNLEYEKSITPVVYDSKRKSKSKTKKEPKEPKEPKEKKPSVKALKAAAKIAKIGALSFKTVKHDDTI